MVSCAYELLMVCGGIEKVHVGILLAYKKPLLKWKRPLIFEKRGVSKLLILSIQRSKHCRLALHPCRMPG